MENDLKKIKEIREEVTKENKRFISLTPDTPIEIEEWRKIAVDNFPELALPSEIGLSVMAQLLIEDIKNPFALVYVDVPSSGKTIALNFLSAIKELAYTTDNFSPASFVSHAANKPKKELTKIDMLPQIQYKTLIIRDLAPAFAKKDEDVQAMLGVLIRVLDGEGLETNSGLHGKRGYIGDYLFMMLSASTPIRPRIWKAMGNLGSRLFFLNIGGKEKSENALAEQLKISCRQKEEICRIATIDFIKTLWNKFPTGINWDKQKENPKLTQLIAKFAKILARLRSSINVWEEKYGEKKFNHTQPITEMPDRLNQLLYNLARGHALVCGRRQLSLEDMGIVARVSLDSAPPNRAKIFRILLKNDGRLSTDKVMEELKCSRPTALKEMQQLVILGIVETKDNLENDIQNSPIPGRIESEVSLKKDFAWFLTDESKQILSHGQK